MVGGFAQESSSDGSMPTEINSACNAKFFQHKYGECFMEQDPSSDTRILQSARVPQVSSGDVIYWWDLI